MRKIISVSLICIMLLTSMSLISCDFFNDKSETTCPSCETKCSADAKFCTSCGTELLRKTVCQSCNTENLPGAKFCTNCGSSLINNVNNNENPGYEDTVGDNEDIGNDEIVSGNESIGNDETVNDNESVFIDDGNDEIESGEATVAEDETTEEQTVWLKTRETQDYLGVIHVCEYYYDSNGFLIAETQTNINKNLLLLLVKYTNDSYGNPIIEQVTSYDISSGKADYYQTVYENEYDANGRLIAVTNKRWNYTTTYTYDANGRLIWKSISGGNTFYYEYDPEGRLIQKSKVETNSYGQAVASVYAVYTYDSNGLLIQKEENGQIFDYFYDLQGNVIKEIVNGTTVVTYEYEYMSLNDYCRLGKDKILPDGVGMLPEVTD